MNRHRKQASEKTPWLTTIMLTGVFIVIIYCIYVAYGVNANANAPTPTTIDRSIDLRHPQTNPVLDQEMVEYEGFTVNFNPTLHIPNWVSWEMTPDKIYGTNEWDKFMPDNNVKGSPKPGDYTGSGFDRGHMAPRADMKWSRETVRQCYYMTNMCPQVHTLNAGAWKKLEAKCRDWAEIDSTLIIICGPVLTIEPDTYIGESQVAVPKAFFKVIAAPFTNPPRAIGFIMNNGRVEGGLQAAAVSVDSVEALTGHDFFTQLPDSIENAIEKECQFHKWSARKPKS